MRRRNHGRNLRIPSIARSLCQLPDARKGEQVILPPGNGPLNQRCDIPVEFIHAGIRMCPQITEVLRLQRPEKWLDCRPRQEPGTRRHKKPHGILDRIDAVEQIFILSNLENFDVILQIRPGRKGNERWTENNPGATDRLQRFEEVAARVPLRQIGKNGVA